MIGEYTTKPEEILRFQINRNVINFYKNMLILLEDIDGEHSIALQKLYDNLPNEYKNYVNLADYLTEEKFGILRSKILSGGNEVIRALEDQLKNFDIKFKQ